MCTVTRPGLASIAASTAVELAVSLLQHPDGYGSWRIYIFCWDSNPFPRVHAPAPPIQTRSETPDPSTPGSVLGLVPHQLRGFLAQFRSIPIVGAAYDRCTGCSETVYAFFACTNSFFLTGHTWFCTGSPCLRDTGIWNDTPSNQSARIPRETNWVG